MPDDKNTHKDTCPFKECQTSYDSNSVASREATMASGGGPVNAPEKYNAAVGGTQKIDPTQWTGRKSAEKQ